MEDAALLTGQRKTALAVSPLRNDIAAGVCSFNFLSGEEGKAMLREEHYRKQGMSA